MAISRYTAGYFLIASLGTTACTGFVIRAKNVVYQTDFAQEVIIIKSPSLLILGCQE